MPIVTKGIYVKVWLQPPDGFKTSGPASNPFVWFQSRLLVLYDKRTVWNLLRQFVIKNLRRTVYMYTISFVINEVNCLNNWRIGWPLWKQASYSISVCPASFWINELIVQLLPRRCPPAGFEAVHQAGFKAGHYLSPLINRASMFQSRPAHFKTSRPALKRAGLEIGP